MILAGLMLVTLEPLSVLGHGNMRWPPTWFGPNRTININLPEDVSEGNDYNKSIIMWYSDRVNIPDVATLDPSFYTFPSLHGQDKDVLEKNPWMAPGTARVYSPCGVAGGNPFGCGSSKHQECPGAGFSYGSDARDINWKNAISTEWQRGGKAQVGWGIWANHGGGYSYRLCKVGEDGPGGVTEDCFQKTPLKFASENSWVQYDRDEKPRVEFKANRTQEGTYPPRSEWTMNPVPNQIFTCKENCPILEFPARVEGLHGFGTYPLFNMTLMDEVEVPEDLMPGKYVLSFRWDCEETPQIWNACSNILIV